ncbi:MAG: carboxypeptidase regulatory-like domain-containing protein, partial [Acidobacteriota bacterium]|nr:carboxypeptidase regulatory-like domain-containing protein [Acidobacteriota bacterium]
MRSILAFALCVAAVFGQTNQATISGVVTDTQGGVIAGAKVAAADIETSAVTSAVSNDAGFYLLPNLAVGGYTLTVEREGFRRSVRKDIQLNTGQTLGLDVKLELGTVNETVSVSGEVPLVETRTSDVTQLIESKSIEDLPLGNRRALNVIALTGAAVFVGYGNSPGNANPNFSLAGGRTQSQMFWIDGGSGQNMRLGVGQINLDPPVDTVDEIKVLSNNYQAEYGGSAGGVIVETTKSGTNQWHGSAYEYLRNNAMDAPGYFAPVQNGAKVTPKLRYNVFGGTFGGPVRRDKTFFFFAYEGQQLRTGGVDTLTVPTAAQRTGDFSQTFNQAGKQIPIYDPTTRVQFPGNAIPSNRLDPVALNALKYYPLPNRPADNISGANNFRANYVIATPANFYMAKVDHNFSARDRVTGRYMWNGGTSSNTSVYPFPAASPRNSAENQQQYTYANWTRVVSAAAVNDVRFSYTYRLFHNLSGGIGGKYPEKLALTGVQDNA